MNKRIARVESTHLGNEDHGIFTAMLHVNYGGSVQGVGGYVLGDHASDFIQGVLCACGVDSWEKVKGRTILVLTDGESFGAAVLGIENLPTEPGERFLFADWQAKARSR